MNMLEIFKNTLQEGMEITKNREMSNKYKITLSFNGMSSTCELNKLCTPGNEKSICMKAIDTAISTMYIDAENYQEAKAWLNGERWGSISFIKTIQPDMREKVEEYIGELEEEIQRCISLVEENIDKEYCEISAMESRIQTLEEVKNDLKSRLEEIL